MQGQGVNPRSNSELWGPELKTRSFPFEKSGNQTDRLAPTDEFRKIRGLSDPELISIKNNVKLHVL
jgi:hypothetical protein